jgi:hypothetical protein
MCEDSVRLADNLNGSEHKNFIISQDTLCGFAYTWTDENIPFDLAHIERTLSTHVKGNDRKGMVGEKLTVTYLEELKAEFETEHPTWTMDIHHNPFSPKKYRKNRGHGIDILVVIRHNGKTMKKIAIEVKNYAKRRLTPHSYKTHVETRFSDIGDATPILVTFGITNKVTRIQHLTHGIKAMLHYIITSSLPPRSERHNSLSPLFHIPCIVHSIQEPNIMSNVSYGTVTVTTHSFSLLGCG